ncbi:MAG: hypothetical protein QM669_12190 [Siphonobacter sp.]
MKFLVRATHKDFDNDSRAGRIVNLDPYKKSVNSCIVLYYALVATHALHQVAKQWSD